MGAPTSGQGCSSRYLPREKPLGIYLVKTGKKVKVFPWWIPGKTIKLYYAHFKPIFVVDNTFKTHMHSPQCRLFLARIQSNRDPKYGVHCFFTMNITFFRYYRNQKGIGNDIQTFKYKVTILGHRKGGRTGLLFMLQTALADPFPPCYTSTTIEGHR